MDHVPTNYRIVSGLTGLLVIWDSLVSLSCACRREDWIGKEEKVDGNDIFVTRKENETNMDKKASRERRRGGLKAPIVL